MRTGTLVGIAALLVSGCGPEARRPAQEAADVQEIGRMAAAHPSDFWNGATVYFLLTDRFANGDTANDHALGRAQDGAVLRSFMGGDLAGVLEKMRAGYFDSLGVDVLWMTPFEEQIRGAVDEGTGRTYAFHGYWTRDWTAVDPALGTTDDLRAVVDEAHRRGIRVLMDAVINHTGPVTPLDPGWPGWTRSGPKCEFESYTTTVDCDLVTGLPDILTNSDVPVELPGWLLDKWREEGRLDREMAKLDAFFARTGYPRAPRYYIVSWLTDWVRELGFDGYRIDTARHFEESVAAELKLEAELAFAEWKEANPEKVVGDLPFFMLGEVGTWTAEQGRTFDFGDRKVDYFDYGYDGLINFGFHSDVEWPIDSLFSWYSHVLHRGALRGVTIFNFVDSHDETSPYDPDRQDPFGAGTKLLLAPGAAQIYYGDELARPLRVAGANGDANLRSFMNWGDLERDGRTEEILEHWRKLGRFRENHASVGAGEHHELQAEPYIFSRTLEAEGVSDRVLVAMDQGKGPKTVPVFGVFPDGVELTDEYSGQTGTVTDGVISLVTDYDLVLLGERR